MLSQPEKSLRSKVWAVIFITFIFTSSAVVWSYRSFTELMQSIDQLSQPNNKLTLINSILHDFISAENNIQSYIITGNTQSAHTYEQQVERVRSQILQLKLLTKADSSQLRRIDSLEVVFQKKLDYLNRFLTLKKKRQNTAFTKLALALIEANTEDTARVEKEIYQYTNTIKDLRPVLKKELVTKKDTSKGLWIALKRLFSKDIVRYDTILSLERDYFTYDDVSIDTSVIQSYSPDTVIQKVKKILAQTKDLELRMQQNLTQRELALLQQSQLFMNEIQSIINELEGNERTVTDERKNSASTIATGSTKIIILIGLGAMLVGGILLTFITRDITRVSYFRHQLEIAKLQAEELTQIKETFLANMSHEIRTPLSSILGFTKLLKNSKLSPEQQKYMQAVDSSSIYLTEVVNDILDYSKIESGKLQLANAPFSIELLSNDVQVMFLLTAQNKQLEFNIKISEKVPEWVIGDVFRIKQVINNLVSNALKFTNKGGITVHIDGKWFKENFYLQITVTDTGVGIDADKLDMIFDSFNQEDASTADHYGGTGLGLSICRQLTEAMHGSISVVSEKNKGTEFVFKLPLEKVSQSVIKHKEITRADKSFYQAHVVLVDDDHWNALLLETLLKRKVNEVKVFLNPQEALKYVNNQKGKIDLLFTDLKMPRMSGQAFAKCLRNMGFDKPIVAITAHLHTHQLDNLDSLGINGICTKPYQEEQINEVLLQFLGYLNGSKKIQNLKTDNIYSIDISDIKHFAGNNQEKVQELFSELVKNNREQVTAFTKLAQSKSWEKLGDLAHQMSPTYDYTKIHQISELLNSIELYVELSNFSRVEELSKQVIIELKNCLKAFERTTSRMQTHNT